MKREVYKSVVEVIRSEEWDFDQVLPKLEKQFRSEKPDTLRSILNQEYQNQVKKMPNLSMPVIPMARTQLEELVKNLDAELVLDCVSKKMFDNFNMWELQLRKMQLNKNTGIKRVEVMLQDMEHVLVELKKMVDKCLTHTKLCDKPAPSVTVGEHLQLALNSHDGPLYLEQPNHIPEEYHKYFGIQALPLISSPQSESNTLVTNPEDDENSNSMMSGNSEKEGLGAQMVLEQNLGLQDDHDEDEDSNSKKARHESSNSKIDDSLIHDEESNEKSQQKNESENAIVVTSTPQDHQVTSVTTAEQQPQRTRLPSFSSIIANSPKSELQDICLVGDAETPQVPDDHHSNPSNSRRGSIESDTRPSLDIRRCSLDQSFTANLNNPNQDSMGRRASVDNGLMIRSTLETGFVESFSTSEMLNLDHPVPDCPYTASTASVTSIESPVISSSIMSMNTLGTPAVSTIMTSIDSTHVTFSQQLASGVQSLPPSGPPSVQGDPRHASMPSSPLGSVVHHGSVGNAGNPPPVSSQNQNSSNFLISELESVLGTGGDFSFTTPSPEKLLPSIPPSSMMIKSEESDKNSKKSQRIDFLGALKESSNKEATKDTKDQEADTLGPGFDPDSQSNDLIRSTLVDVTHPVSFATTSLSESKNDDHHHEQNDTLSQLFEEITDAQEAAVVQANNQDNKE